MKKRIGQIGIMAGCILLAGCGPETQQHSTLRMMDEAPGLAREETSNYLVGITRILSVEIHYGDAAPANLSYQALGEPDWWTGEIVAERVNAVGGIERTNLYARFTFYEEAGKRHLCCAIEHFQAPPFAAGWPGGVKPDHRWGPGPRRFPSDSL